MDISLSKLQELVMGSLACCSPWGRKESDTTEWTELNWTEFFYNWIKFLLMPYFILILQFFQKILIKFSDFSGLPITFRIPWDLFLPLGSWTVHSTSFYLHPPSWVVWKNSLQTEVNLYQDVEVRVRETAIAILVELLSSVQFSSLSRVQLFATPWTAARQASLSITNSEPAQTHVHWVGDVIQPSHPLLSPSPLTFNLSQHQSLFQ